MKQSSGGHNSNPYLNPVVLFRGGLRFSGWGLHHLSDGVAEGVAQHKLCVGLKKLRPRFQLRQELLLEVVAHQLTLRTKVSLC